MELFSKRESLVQNIAYMAIMAAINVIFVLLSNILPVLLFLLVFILPLTSAIVTIYCKKRYYPIYFVVTLLLCFAVTSGFSIFDTFIYVLPSLITGFLFGYAIEKQVPAIYVLVVVSLIQYALTILTFFILGKIVTDLNLTETIINAFGLKDYAFKAAILQVFLFIVSEIQILLSLLFIKIEIKKLGLDINLYCKKPYFLYLFQIVFFALSVISYFYFKDYTIVMILSVLPIYVYQIVILMLKRKIWIYVSLVIIHLAFLFLFALLYSYTTSPNQIILILILFGLTTIIDFLSNYCFKENINNIK